MQLIRKSSSGGSDLHDHILPPADDVSVSSVFFSKWLACSTVCQWLDSQYVGALPVKCPQWSQSDGSCEISGIIIAAALINLCS